MKDSLVAGTLSVSPTGSLIKKEGERSIPVPPIDSLVVNEISFSCFTAGGTSL